VTWVASTYDLRQDDFELRNIIGRRGGGELSARRWRRSGWKRRGWRVLELSTASFRLSWATSSSSSRRCRLRNYIVDASGPPITICPTPFPPAAPETLE